MIFNLIERFLIGLDAAGLGFLRVFLFIEFRVVLAVLMSFALVMALGRPVIRTLYRLKIGDRPEFHNQSLNELAKGKTNTPTMGGVLICGAILLTSVLLADLFNFYIVLAVTVLVWLAALGGVDDYLKLVAARRAPGSRDGLHTWEKLVMQVGLAVIVGLFVYYYAQAKYRADPEGILEIARSLNLPFLKTWQLDAGTGLWVASEHLIVLGQWSFVTLAVVVIAGTSNAVNLTDGMDGLASGVMVVVALAFAVLCMLAGWGDGTVAKQLLIPYVPLSDELAIVAAAIAGACLGFLWFNGPPAAVFMGDTGSLALGGLIGYMAVVVRQEFLLVIIGGVFVLEALSVILQVGYFKWTRARFGEGRRVFRTAPIHHHFHLGGWTEPQVVVRAWVVSVVLAAVALASIKLR